MYVLRESERERERERERDCVCVCVCCVEEVQRAGALDPVAYQIDQVIQGGKPVVYSLDNRNDGPKIAEIVTTLKVCVCVCVRWWGGGRGTNTHPRTYTHPQVSDKDINKLFGLRNADRDRAMKLFTGGHIISDSVSFASGKMKTTNKAVWILSGEVVASQRARVYHTTVVFDKVNSTHTHTYIHAYKRTYKHTHIQNRSLARL